MEKELFDLSEPQKAIWMTEQYCPNTSLNNISGNLIIETAVNFGLLEKALNLYIQKNETLRFRLCLENGIPKQYISKFHPFSFPFIKVQNKKDFNKLNKQLGLMPFTLLDSDLFRFTFFQFPDFSGGFYISFHHLIGDAWSMSLFLSEVMNLYSSLLKEEEIDFSSNPSYKEYLQSESEYFSSKKFLKDAEFWRSAFDFEPEFSSIVKLKRTQINTSARRISFQLNSDFVEKISAKCRQWNCSLYAFFMAIYSFYIAKINHISTPILGTPILNRTSFKEKQMAGMFISTVPFFTHIDFSETFVSFIKKVASQQLRIFRHQKYPYNLIEQMVKEKYDFSSNLYDVVFSYQNARDNRSESDIPYHTEWLFSGHILDTLDIHFYDMDNQNSVCLYYDYQTEQLTKEDIYQMHNRILAIINQILSSDNLTLNQITILSKQEEDNILNNFNKTSYAYPKEKSFISYFEEHAFSHPEETALIFRNEKITYQQLNNKANQLAHFLIQQGLKENDIIGILWERSSYVVLSMLAILKAGGAYLLIEPTLPNERIEFMLQNAQAKLLLSNLLSSTVCPVINILQMDLSSYSTTNLDLSISNLSNLSVVYTSGSTGTPKGVLLKRSSMINLIIGYQNSMKIQDYQTFVSICSVAFDMFAAEIWIPLLSGKTLVLADTEEQKNPLYLSKLLEKEKVEFMLITSSKMELLLAPTVNYCLQYLKAIQLGGEVLNPRFYERVKQFTNASIFNGYGPTETTACCCTKKITSSQEITLGKPFVNVQIYICDSSLNLCPIGVEGELCIVGEGVSKGYINNPDITKKHFVSNPYGKGLLYRSGDIAKYTNSGELIYVGRKDYQIKIHGLRVELEEINNQLRNIRGIRNAYTMIAKVNHTDSICSYITTSEKLELDDIKQSLTKKLPYYMVPSYIKILSELPLNSSGKVDKKLLPEITFCQNSVLPSTKTEKKLAFIWKDLLNLSSISADSNFFDLGGDSLSAIKLITKIYEVFHCELKIKNIFNYSTLSALANYLDSHIIQRQKTSIPVAPNQEEYPLSSAQKRIFLSSSLAGKESLLYNTPGGILIDGIPDSLKLEACFQKIINRHDSLRTYFEVKEEKIVQKILPQIPFKLEIIDCQKEELTQYFQQFVKPFFLHNAPLFRAELLRFSDQTSCLLLDFHHIIFDGESANIIVKELCSLYNGTSLPSSSLLRYCDFAYWENTQLQNHSLLEDETYWLTKFQGEIPTLNMPTNFPRGSLSSFDGTKIMYTINKTLFDKIHEQALEFHVTPFIIFLCAYYVLLYKYTGQTDLLVGTPVSARTRPELSSIVGMFVNSLALRQQINSHSSIVELIQEIQNNCINDFEHQSYPFDELIKKLNLSRDSSHSPLFDTMFTYQNNGVPCCNLDGLKTEYYIPDTFISKFDFSVEIVPTDTTFEIKLEYCTALFENCFMEHFLKHFINILQQITESPNQSIGAISILSDKEVGLLNKFNTYPLPCTNLSIFQQFEQQVLKNPNQIALLYLDKKMTYQELYNKVCKFSSYLIRRGLKKGEIVATFLDRSFDLIISMLAILKCGCVYLPIPKDTPSERIEYILQNSKTKRLIVQNCDSMTFCPRQDLDTIYMQNLTLDSMSLQTDAISYHLEDTIYIIYTSGSTGKPKGVQITNQNLSNFISSFQALYHHDVSIKDTCLASTNIGFDVSIWEFFFTLLNGATLCLYHEPTICNVYSYCKAIQENSITMAYIPPNILEEVYEILSSFDKVTLNKILIGVEPIRSTTIAKYYHLNTNMQIINGYGPTETTICATACEITPSLLQTYDILPIGHPLFNLKVYVLDSDLQPVPFSVPGELFIAGPNVGKGYLYQENLTKEKYLIVPNTNELVYRTGDTVKWNLDGNLSFIGRKDFQVKINGHRVELEEIQKTILQYPNIEKCIVLCTQTQQQKKQLIAYFSSINNIVINDLRHFLALKLPSYFIPNHFIKLDTFPVTTNGKIDRQKLLSIPLSNKQVYESPKNEFQKTLVKLWKKYLPIKEIGITDNFFELGGDSLIAIRMQIEAFKLGLNLSYSDIFLHPTIKELSNEIQTTEPDIPLEKYNYSKINHLLSQNTLPISSKKLVKRTFSTVLLLGATGFVGCHILDSLLKQTDSIIYCLIRNKNNTTAKERLLHTLHYYFGHLYDNQINKRIYIIEGDITLPNLGLQPSFKTDCVINSAANVKHYGQQDSFRNTNISGVQHIIDFCKQKKCYFLHLSTMSVSGNVFAEDSFHASSFEKISKVTFKENQLYIGQDLSNLYLCSKFLAERLILQEVANNNLRATILRLGNITSRYTDGVFQMNVSENAFLNRIKSFLQIGSIPDYLSDGYLEFTPVDVCSKAIVSILQTEFPYTVFHLFNNKHLALKEFISILNNFGIPFHVSSKGVFDNTVKNLMEKEDSSNILSGIINDFDKEKKIIYDSNVILNNTFSNAVLNKMEFEWPVIHQKYLYYYFSYLRSIGYLEINLEGENYAIN